MIRSILLCFIISLATGLAATSKFTGKSNLAFRNETEIKGLSKTLLEIIGRREPTAWRFKYIEEFHPDEKRLLVVEESLDERLANIAYTSVTARTNSDFSYFNSGSEQLDEKNLLSFEGSQVDEEKCAHHLAQMLTILDDLSFRLALKRSGEVEKLDLDEKHLHLARVLESYGRYDSGFLSGKISSIGNYEQCLLSNLLLDVDGEGELVDTRFCWARMKADKHLDAQLRWRQPTKYEAVAHVISAGICIPKTCHTRSFKANRELFERLIDSQFKLPQELYLEENLELDSIFCLPDEDSEFKQLPFGGRLFVIFVSSWIALGLFATMFRSSTNQKQAHKDTKGESKEDKVVANRQQATSAHNSTCSILMESLDFGASIRDFLMLDYEHEQYEQQNKKQQQPNQKPVRFANLNPVKVLGMGYVVLGHATMIIWNNSSHFINASTNYITDRALFPMLVGVFVVDSFFVISGLLLSFGILKRIDHLMADMRKCDENGAIEQKQRQAGLGFYAKLCLQFICIRWLRLVPMYTLLFWFNKSVFLFLDTGGPNADYGLNKLTTYGACQNLDSWWTPVSFLSAWVPMTHLCLPQAWSVSCDLFYSLSVVPLCILLAKKPKTALSLMILISVGSTWNAWRAYLEADPMKKFEVTEAYAQSITYLLTDFSYLYTLPHYRITTILVGVFVGYLLYEEQKLDSYQNTDKQNPYLISTMRIMRNPIVTMLAVAVAVQPFVSAYFMQEIRKSIPLEDRITSFEQTNVFHRVLWAISNGVLFIRMVTDWQNSALMKASRGRFWKILVKLNYAILLIHLDVLNLSVWSPTSGRMFSKWRSIYDFFACYTICLPIAAILFIIFENPIDKFMRKMLHT